MSVLDNAVLTLVDTFEKVNLMFDWFNDLDPEETILGFDTETSSADDMFKDSFKLRTVQIGDETHGWLVPWEGFGGFVMELLRRWEKANGLFVAHNLSYDAKVMIKYANWDIPWHLFHDTYIMARIIMPDEQAGLKPMTDKYVDRRASAGQDELKKAFKDFGWNWDTVPIDFPAYWIYGALDPVLAVLLYKVLKPLADKYHKAYDLEFSYSRVCTYMEIRGMRLDMDYVHKMNKEYTQKIDEGREYAEDRWGINIGSNPDISGLFKKLGAEFSVFTDKGAPSVNADQLELFSESDNDEVREVAQHILKIRRLEKINSSYFENFIAKNVNGRIHPQIITMAALTGRSSIKNPATQTLPSDSPEVRNCFLANTDDEVIISSDYSSQELRMSAHFSNDPGLIEAFRKADEEGADVFVETGKKIFNDPTMTKADNRRATIKTFFYASGYGAGIPKMASQLGIPESEMQEVADMIDKSFPGIKDFSRSVIEKGENISSSGEAPYTELEDGRRIPTYKRKEYKLVNYTFQGTSAIMTKKAVLRLDALGLSKYILIPIHDEVLFSIPRDIYEELMPEIEDAMAFLTEYNLPFPTEAESDGRRWGNAYCEFVNQLVDIGPLYSGKNEIPVDQVKISSHKDTEFIWECPEGHEVVKKIHDKIIYPECEECLV